jgi:hypothetical protein
MINKVINYLYRTKLGEWYLLFLMWLEDLQMKRARKNFRLTKAKATATIKQELLVEGVRQIKCKINAQLVNRTEEEYEQILSKLEELGHMAVHYEDEQYIKMIDNMKRAFVYQGRDIKTEEDKALMIEKRIRDYQQLQNHVERRKKLREARKTTSE